MALLDDREIESWRWEPRDAKRERDRAKLQQVVDQVRPAIEAGDTTTAQRIIRQANPKTQRDSRETARKIGKRVIDRWSGILPDDEPRPTQRDSRRPLVSAETLASVKRTGYNPLPLEGPRQPRVSGPLVSQETLRSVNRTGSQRALRERETPSEAMERWRRAGGPIPTLSEAQVNALDPEDQKAYRSAMGIGDKYDGFLGGLRKRWDLAKGPASTDTPGSTFEALTSAGARNRRAIEALIKGEPAPTRYERDESFLPPVVKQVAEAVVDPLTYATYGLTKPAQALRLGYGATPGVRGLAARAGGAIFDDALLGAKGVYRNVAAEAGARIASEGTNELLPEDMNPLLRAGLVTGAGLGGGVGGWTSPEIAGGVRRGAGATADAAIRLDSAINEPAGVGMGGRVAEAQSFEKGEIPILGRRRVIRDSSVTADTQMDKLAGQYQQAARTHGADSQQARAIRQQMEAAGEARPQPLAKERLWFHSTENMEYDLPDPDLAVGSQTGITQGPGVYMASNPSKSIGYGNRTFAAEFDGTVLDLTQEADLSLWGRVRQDIEAKMGRRLSAGGRSKPHRADLATTANGYGARDSLADDIVQTLSEMRESGQTVPRDALGRFQGVSTTNDEQIALAIVNNALADSGVDAVFHHSPKADGDVLIVLTGGKAVRTVGDFRGTAEELLRLPEGATLQDIKRAGAERIVKGAVQRRAGTVPEETARVRTFGEVPIGGGADVPVPPRGPRQTDLSWTKPGEKAPEIMGSGSGTVSRIGEDGAHYNIAIEKSSDGMYYGDKVELTPDGWRTTEELGPFRSPEEGQAAIDARFADQSQATRPAIDSAADWGTDVAAGVRQSVSPIPPARAITKTDTGKGYVTRDSAGRTRTVPDAGHAGAEKAIADKQEALHAPGPIMEKLPPVIRKGVALFTPSVGQDQTVLVAYRARQGVRAQLSTQFATAMRPYEDAVEQAMRDTPARYIGPKGTDQQNLLIGTAKDIAERPHMYDIPAPLRKALDDYDKAQWDNVSSVARGKYGVRVRPYSGKKRGFVFTPTVRAADSIDDKLEAAMAGTGVRRGAKQRAYETAWERVGKDPEFVPETNIRELSSVHTQAMAGNASNETFKLGAGGKTGVEVVDELHPGLRQKKMEVQAKLRSAKQSLATAQRQQGQATLDAKRVKTLQEQIGRRMKPLEDRVESLGDEYGPELSHLSGELYELRIQLARLKPQEAKATGRVAAKESAQVAIKREIDRLQNVVDRLVTAYQTAGVEPYVLDRATGRYYKPEAAKSVNELLRVPEGFTKTFIDATDEIRATHLAGDGSPLSIQGFLGLLSDPITATKTIRRMIGENPRLALQRLARDEAEDVGAYTFATGRQFGQQVTELSIHQSRRGVGRIPKVGDIEDNLFAVVQRMMYEQWKHDRALLLRDNPGMSRELAGAEAANLLSKVVPGLDPAERGVSALRAGVERVPVTSMSFVTSPALLGKDAGSGVIKLARAAMLKLAKSPSADPKTAWQSLSGREQLAIRRVAAASGTVAAISMTSAVLSAPSRNMSVQDALKEQFDWNSRYFMSIQMGDGRSLPIGGPFRSAIKGVMPDRNGVMGGNLPGFLSSKLNTPIRLPYDLVKNRDFYGNEIYQGNFARPDNLLRALYYSAESAAPITAGEIMEQARTGALSVGSALQGGGAQLAGTNYSPVSASERLNQIARSLNAGTDYEGMGFWQSPPARQEEIRQANPGLWNDYIKNASDQRQQDEREKRNALEQQAGDDALFMSGELSREDWIDGTASRRDQLVGATRAIYADSAQQGGRWPVLDRYYQAIDDAKVNGRVDWDKVNSWLAQQSQADRTFIDENTGLGKTSLQRLHSELADEYYSIPRYRGMSADDANEIDDLWQRVRNHSRSADQADMLRALRMLPEYQDGTLAPEAVRGVRRRIMGLLSQSNYRDMWRKQHPESVLITGRGRLSAAQRKAIQDALERKR